SATVDFSPERRARTSGNLSGIARFPLQQSSVNDIVAVHLLSALGNSRLIVGGGSGPYGPDYDSFLTWDGPAALNANVVALGTFESVRPEDGLASSSYRAGIAWAPLVLADAETESMDLKLEEVPVGTVSGSVRLPNQVTLSLFEEHYRFPFPNGLVGFPNANVVGVHARPTPAAFAFDLPWVDKGGASLCLAVTGDGDGALRTERCGVPQGARDFILELQGAPVLTTPAAGILLSPDTQFSWSPFENGISELEFSSAGSPSIVHIFIGKTRFAWTELGTFWPMSVNTTYNVKVTGIGPFASIDEAVSSSGLGAPIRAETRRSASASIAIATAPR
ncbi:MAG: hypothetical protein ABI560_16425, partial [Myxococcales bacterium]